jgi:hypothetical protein
MDSFQLPCDVYPQFEFLDSTLSTNLWDVIRIVWESSNTAGGISDITAFLMSVDLWASILAASTPGTFFKSWMD